jgi:hypothetical protein
MPGSTWVLRMKLLFVSLSQPSHRSIFGSGLGGCFHFLPVASTDGGVHQRLLIRG